MIFPPFKPPQPGFCVPIRFVRVNVCVVGAYETIIANARVDVNCYISVSSTIPPRWYPGWTFDDRIREFQFTCPALITGAIGVHNVLVEHFTVAFTEPHPQFFHPKYSDRLFSFEKFRSMVLISAPSSRPISPFKSCLKPSTISSNIGRKRPSEPI